MPTASERRQLMSMPGRSAEHGLGPWAAIEKTTGSWIAKLGPDLLEDWPGEHRIEVGWILHRAWWGRGLATEGALASIRMPTLQGSSEGVR